MDPAAVVTDQATLDSYCRRWRQAGRFAFDTEFIRDDSFDAALCLIQVNSDGQVVLIDPTADVDVAPFWELVTDPQVLTIVHAGKEDFEVCLRATGQPPRNVFDVQIAAGFVGFGYPLSLIRLVEQVVHRRISKAQTLTDWLRRPLTPEQVRYAVEDVAHLLTIHDRLAGDLEKRARLEWAREEFRRFEDPEFYRPPAEDRVFRLKGSKKLDGLGLAVLARLIDWRDRWAAERNRPIRALVRDDVLVEIARRRPRSAADLEVLRGFPQARNPKIVGELLGEIDRARNTPRSQWPQPYEAREESPMSRATLDILSAVTRATCCEQQVSHELVCTASRLRELMEFHRGDSGMVPTLLLGWREKFVGHRLIDLLEGRSELHFSGWPENPRLDVVTHERSRRRA